LIAMKNAGDEKANIQQRLYEIFKQNK